MYEEIGDTPNVVYCVGIRGFAYDHPNWQLEIGFHRRSFPGAEGSLEELINPTDISNR
jgi:hypothetical protein